MKTYIVMRGWVRYTGVKTFRVAAKNGAEAEALVRDGGGTFLGENYEIDCADDTEIITVEEATL